MEFSLCFMKIFWQILMMLLYVTNTQNKITDMMVYRLILLKTKNIFSSSLLTKTGSFSFKFARDLFELLLLNCKKNLIISFILFAGLQLHVLIMDKWFRNFKEIEEKYAYGIISKNLLISKLEIIMPMLKLILLSIKRTIQFMDLEYTELQK